MAPKQEGFVAVTDIEFIVFNDASDFANRTNPLLKTVVVFTPLGHIPSLSVAKFKTLFCASLASILLTPFELFCPIGIIAAKVPFSLRFL